MKHIEEVIKDYEQKLILLEEFQEFIWGLSECTLETLSETYINTLFLI